MKITTEQTSVLEDVLQTSWNSNQSVNQSDSSYSRDIKKILVIDDEDDIRLVEATRLERAGYSTIVAADGREGLRRFYNDRSDLVVLDVAMPKMDGWQVLDRIREVSNLPVLMLTAAATEQGKLRGFKGGDEVVITKPFSSEEFLSRVASALRRAAVSSEIDAPWESDEYNEDTHTPGSKAAETVDGQRISSLPSLSINEFELEIPFQAKHSIATELDGEPHLHNWKMLTRILIPDRLVGPSGKLQEIYIQRLLQELTNELEGVDLNQLDSFAVLEPTPERLIIWLGFRARQELELIGFQVNCVVLQDLGVIGPDGTIQEGNRPMLKIDLQDSDSGPPQVYEVHSSSLPNEEPSQLDAPVGRENVDRSEVLAQDHSISETNRFARGQAETPGKPGISENNQPVTGESRAEQRAQPSETGIAVFFNSKHIISNEFDGEIHAHSWRLRAVVLMVNVPDKPPLAMEKIRDSIQDVVDELEGVVLNGIDPFRAIEPTPERLVAWLSSKIRDKLNTPFIQLRSTTLWDHSTQYVTTWEEEDFRAP